MKTYSYISGFGDGRFLKVSGGLCVGVERCLPLCQQQQQLNHNSTENIAETVGGDVTRLPFRSELYTRNGNL